MQLQLADDFIFLSAQQGLVLSGAAKKVQTNFDVIVLAFETASLAVTVCVCWT
jgi:hypothetical protein